MSLCSDTAACQFTQQLVSQLVISSFSHNSQQQHQSLNVGQIEHLAAWSRCSIKQNLTNTAKQTSHTHSPPVSEVKSTPAIKVKDILWKFH